jgi:two-component system, NtrC family, sensor histidine kinase HydH
LSIGADDMGADQNLKRRLIASSAGLVIIAGGMSLMAEAIIDNATHQIVQMEATIAQQRLQGYLDARAGNDQLFAGPVASAALASFADELARLPNISRANIYSADGFIRYSTDKDLIGVKFRGNTELQESLGGNIIADLEGQEEEEKPEHVALQRGFGKQLIEAYLPLRDSKKTIFAVVEIYEKPTNIEASLANVRMIVWAVTAFAGLLLFGALYWLLRRVYPPGILGNR